MKKLTLLFAFIFILTTLVRAECPPGIILYLDGNSLSDSSGNDFDIIAKKINIEPGKFGNAYSFSGKTNSYIEIPKEVLTNRKEFTISFWFKSSGKGDALLSLLNKDKENYFSLIDQSSPKFYLDGRKIFPNKKFPQFPELNLDDSWHHVAITYQNAAVAYGIEDKLTKWSIAGLYIDGKNPLQDEYGIGTLPRINSKSLKIQRIFLGQNPSFLNSVLVLKNKIFVTSQQKKQAYAGLIDDFVVFNKALSKEEMFDIFYKKGGICEGITKIKCNCGGEINGTGGDDIFQIHNNQIWLNGESLGEAKDEMILNGGPGNDLFVTVGSESQTINGGEGNDRFWIDSTDEVIDLEENEKENHNIIAKYYQPWTNDPFNEDYIFLDSDDNELADPGAGSQSFTNIRYQRFDVPIFNEDPKYSDVVQGAVGDCYFLAVLASIADARPDIIKNAIVSVGDGTYIVRFYRNNNPIYLKIDGDLPVGTRNGRRGLMYAGYPGNEPNWVALFEKAYAFFRYGKNSYNSIAGGWMSVPLQQISNKQATTRWTGGSLPGLFQDVSNGLLAKQSLTTGSYANQKLESPIVGSHAYMIKEVDNAPEAERFTVYNPWGIDGRVYYDSNYNDGLLNLDFNKIQEYFSTVVTSNF